MLTFVAPLLVYLLSFPVMVATLFRVEVGLLYFITFVPILAVVKKLVEFPIGNKFADFLVIALVIGWFIRAKKENKRVFKRSPLNTVVILMVIGSAFSLIQGYISMPLSSEINIIRLQTWKNYMILPMLYFISINNIEKEKLVKWVIICVSLSMLAMDFNFHTTFRWFRTDHYSDSIRVVGTFKSFGPNEMGIFYSMYTFLLLGISYFIENKKMRYFVLFVCMCNFYPILYSFSRSGYLCTLVGLLVIGLLKDRRLLIVLVAIVILYRIILPNAVVERIDMTFLNDSEIIEEQKGKSALELGDITLDTVGRKELWNKAENYFKENPLIGIGFDTFVHMEGMITHNIYLRILAEEGLLGMGIYVVLFIILLWQSYKLFRYSSNKLGRGIGLGFLCCIILDLVGGISGDMWLYYNLMANYWFFMGIVASFYMDYVVLDKRKIQSL